MSFRLLYRNLGDEMTVTASTERNGFPATNVQHPHLVRVWRSSTPAGETLLFDAGEGQKISADMIAVLAHNLTSAATLTVKANDAAAWAAPPLQAAATIVPGIILVEASGMYRLWLLEFEDADNPDGYIQIGRAGLYAAFRTDEPLDRGIKDGLADTSLVADGPSGQRFGNKGRRDQIYELKFGLLSDQLRRELKAIYREIGKLTAVIVVPDDDRLRLPPIYACLETDLAFTGAGGWMWRDEIMRFKETH